MKKNPIEYLDEQQLEELLDYTGNPFNEANQKNIQQQFQQKKHALAKRQKRNRRLAVIASTAAAGLLLVGFAFRDDLKMTYLKHFGDEEQVLLLNSEKLNQSVTDQGLELKALATFKDGDNQYLVSQLTDLTGNRLAKDTTISDWNMFGGGNTQVIDYDPVHKTATLLTSAIGADSYENTGFLLKAFKSGFQESREKFTPDWTQMLATKKTWIDISHQDAQGGSEDPKLTEKLKIDYDQINDSGLKPMEVNAKLTDDLTISNLAYKDGLLHLQLKYPNTQQLAYVWPKLVTKTGKEIPSAVSFSVDQGTHNNATGRPDYDQSVFAVSEKDLAGATLELEMGKYDIYQEGQWAIQMKQPKELPKTTFKDQTISTKNGDLKLSKLRMSPLDFSFDYEGKLQNLKILLQYKDGQTFTSDNHYMEDNETIKVNNYSFQHALADIDQIESITIDGIKLDLSK